MGTIRHQLWIRTLPATVYQAITIENEIGNWWDTPKAVKSEAGIILEFRPGPGHGVLQMRVLDAVPNQRVEWECISSHDKSSPASAWTSTHIVFEITERDRVSLLNFRHAGWDEENEFFAFCNYNWGAALQKLKLYCESRRS